MLKSEIGGIHGTNVKPLIFTANSQVIDPMPAKSQQPVENANITPTLGQRLVITVIVRILERAQCDSPSQQT